MATRKKTAAAKSAVNLSAADFMKNLGKASGLTSLNDKVDEFYPTGNVILDRAMNGGFQKGQMYCIRGPKGSGKSLMSLCLAKTVCDEGGNVAYFDTENKISDRALNNIGLDAYKGGQFQFLTIDTQANAIDVVLQMLDSGIFELVVIDSTNGLYTEEQEERGVHEESKVAGFQAKGWSEWLPLIKQKAAAVNCAVCITQQARDNIGVMYGPSETYSGGRAIEHFATTILRLGPDKQGNEMKDGVVVRQGVSVRIDKHNQGALPGDPIKMKFYIGDDAEWGVDELSSVFDESVRLGVLAPKKKGSPSYVPCPELCQRLGMDERSLTFIGKPKTLSALESDQVLFDAVRDIISEVNAGELTLSKPGDVAVSFVDPDESGDDGTDVPDFDDGALE